MRQSLGLTFRFELLRRQRLPAAAGRTMRLLFAMGTGSRRQTSKHDVRPDVRCLGLTFGNLQGGPDDVPSNVTLIVHGAAGTGRRCLPQGVTLGRCSPVSTPPRAAHEPGRKRAISGKGFTIEASRNRLQESGFTNLLRNRQK